jgi:hypothetical protein
MKGTTEHTMNIKILYPPFSPFPYSSLPFPPPPSALPPPSPLPLPLLTPQACISLHIKGTTEHTTNIKILRELFDLIENELSVSPSVQCELEVYLPPGSPEQLQLHHAFIFSEDRGTDPEKERVVGATRQRFTSAPPGGPGKAISGPGGAMIERTVSNRGLPGAVAASPSSLPLSTLLETHEALKLNLDEIIPDIVMTDYPGKRIPSKALKFEVWGRGRVERERQGGGMRRGQGWRHTKGRGSQ